ncbi:hypothetical protein DL766_009056 [Monosporascus sp. MC13-8B]|nr:hypothetical protein DL766_009056 [Monosporascus sp. MC13-8B]
MAHERHETSATLVELKVSSLDPSISEESQGESPSRLNMVSEHQANTAGELLEDGPWDQRSIRTKRKKKDKGAKSDKEKLSNARKACDWLQEFIGIDDRVFGPLTEQMALPRPIRVAVLDTGCNMNTGFFDEEHNQGDKQRVMREHWKDFLDDKSPEPVDDDGHGTKIATTLLMLLPRAELFIGRVAKNREHFTSPEVYDTISAAIHHAANVKEWNADIIALSFGFSSRPTLIENTIYEALGPNMRKRCLLIFAAANNRGGNEPERFPASYQPFVISARGTRHNGGFEDDYNPDGDGPLYGTLAVEVPCTHKWMREEKRSEVLTISGCSIAAPIMAAIAATYLQYAVWKLGCPGVTDPIVRQSLNRLFEYDGMLALFSFLTRNGGHRRYLVPSQLFDGEGIEKEKVWESTLLAAVKKLQQRVTVPSVNIIPE